ncbi:MAG: methyltransferase [Bacilli bacterium]|nr:methyltransferase [Bacilli bacterium]
MTIVKNDLFDYPNRYIYQYVEGFKFSLDSILLAEFTQISKNAENILDMCTGNAPVPLILSTKTKCKIYGFEIQPEISELAEKSVKENRLEDQITIINEDIKNIIQVFPGKYFDIITCNPPYFSLSDKKVLNKNDALTIARHEIKIDLEDIFQIVKNHLKDNGEFYLVHRPSRLDEIILLADKYQLFVKELQFIVTKNNIPSIILLKIKKHAKNGIKYRSIKDVSKLSSYQRIFEEDSK